MSTLQGARDKIDRAMAHYEPLKARLETFDPHAAGVALGTKSHLDAKHKRFIVSITKMPEFPSWIGLGIGDVVHNLRCSLDHLTWAIASRDTGKTPANETKFPILSDWNRWAEEAGRSLRSVHPRNWALFERYQPYLVPKPEHTAIYMLQQLSNTDKHRHINPPTLRGAWTRTVVEGCDDCRVVHIEEMDEGKVLSQGAKLISAKLADVGPKPHVRVKTEFALLPCLPNGMSIPDGLWWIIGMTGLVVDEIERDLIPPLG